MSLNHPTGRERRILKKIENGEELTQDELIFAQKLRERGILGKA